MPVIEQVASQVLHEPILLAGRDATGGAQRASLAKGPCNTASAVRERLATLRQPLRDVERKAEQVLDRLLDARGSAMIAAYERRGRELERIRRCSTSESRPAASPERRSPRLIGPP